MTERTRTGTGGPGAGSMLRRTLGEQRIALVAWRLLVLQNAHPAVAAGVSQLSTYRSHPWRRIEHTMDSGRRLFSSDREVLHLEVRRLARSHRRIAGVDDRGRPYTALDPAVRVWVLVTLYEAMTALHALAGRPLRPAQLDRLYREFRTVCEAFELPDELFPPTAADVPGYISATIRDTLEFTEAAQDMLYTVLTRAPAPRRLGRLRPAWPLLRRLVARFLTTLTLADLPPEFRAKFGLPRSRGAAVLSWVVHRGARAVALQLPDRLRYRTLSDGGRARPQQAGAPRPARTPRRDNRPARMAAFYRQVMDQTGDGRLTSADFQAMAHNICWPLELDQAGESAVYAAFDTWWHHLLATMDADGNGEISCEEFVTAMLAGIDRDPDYLDQGLHVAVRAMFRAADLDHSGLLDAEEYRTLFGGSRVHPAELTHGFRQLDADGDGQITEEEFVRGFAEFFTARTESTAGTQLLGRP
ncbi:oxygenase MpaB family protein [Kitasatospora sp. SolWspMP-SS2h]|uniref:oxygenase MpaB family protein n=1 Tax=Kitasatospora sp. SolWspMP-SS2h TaxID=1305729 RepID=UPI000DB91071|nr:oxygenase MpaB family protein [Kitasatospora sp. SolWspMP-SS2h]